MFVVIVTVYLSTLFLGTRMRTPNGVQTVRLQVSVDTTTDQVLQRMIPIGLHGRNKSEVASWIIREWIWHNQADLARVGVIISPPRDTQRNREKTQP
jgi:hypothetical protein